MIDQSKSGPNQPRDPDSLKTTLVINVWMSAIAGANRLDSDGAIEDYLRANFKIPGWAVTQVRALLPRQPDESFSTLLLWAHAQVEDVAFDILPEDSEGLLYAVRSADLKTGRPRKEFPKTPKESVAKVLRALVRTEKADKLEEYLLGNPEPDLPDIPQEDPDER